MSSIDWSSLWKKEDWWALWLGLLIFFLGLLYVYGYNVLGWAANVIEWVDPAKAIVPISKAYEYLGGLGSLIVTYIVFLAILSIGAAAMGWNLKRFALGFTVIFFLTMLCWVIGHYAYIASTDPAKSGIPWSLRLTGEFGYLFALILGLIIGNFFRKFAEKLREAARPEWFIKTAIVLLGAIVGVKAVTIDPRVLANFFFRGVAAIIEAYLIYWALTYFVARKFFKFSREWAAPLASGIAICGVSAAIATAAAIRARPVVPIMVASLVVVFAAVELVILPIVAAVFLAHQPLVAGAWMGLAVKTDGAAAASASIVDALIVGTNPQYEPLKGWILNAGVMVKLFIDIFIGVWAFILAVIWVYYIDRRPGEKVRKIEIWFRFPKFVIGYFVTFFVLLALASAAVSAATAGLPPEKVPDATKKALKPFDDATKQTDVFRKMFFALTFFSIGLVTDFSTLRKEGYGKLAAVYFIALFGFIIWIGLAISWIFFHDVHHFFLR
ncbi:MAG: putative sulfate exporter family transporter [Pyrobaculum sp.]